MNKDQLETHVASSMILGIVAKEVPDRVQECVDRAEEIAKQIKALVKKAENEDDRLVEIAALTVAISSLHEFIDSL